MKLYRFSRVFRESEEWFFKNSLALNVNKTKIINFSRSMSSIDFESNGCLFPTVQDVRFLGMHVNRGLSWDVHLTWTRKRISKQIYLLRNISQHVDLQTVIRAYYGLVYTQLRYGIIFWGNSINFKDLFILQKAALRAIFKLKRRTSCVPYFKEHGILTLPSIYIYEASVFVKQNLHLFRRTGDIHSYNTRQINTVPTFTDKAYIMRSANFALIKIFNKLPAQ